MPRCGVVGLKLALYFKSPIYFNTERKKNKEIINEKAVKIKKPGLAVYVVVVLK